MDMFTQADFWVAVGQIIVIDVLLGGDNAVVIALACRRLPAAQRTLGILWGTAGAIVLRVVLIAFAVTLLAVPYLKLVGAALLLWIAVKLLAPDAEDPAAIRSSDRLLGAIRTIIIADFVMSLDNVIGIAGVAGTADPGHQLPLIILGLVISIPIVVWGSQFVMRLMDRFPLIITAGGMLLGWIAGAMAVTDPAVLAYLPTEAAEQAGAPAEVAAPVRYGAGAAGAVFALALGTLLKRRSAAAAA